MRDVVGVSQLVGRAHGVEEPDSLISRGRDEELRLLEVADVND